MSLIFELGATVHS